VEKFLTVIFVVRILTITVCVCVIKPVLEDKDKAMCCNNSGTSMVFQWKSRVSAAHQHSWQTHQSQLQTTVKQNTATFRHM